MTVDTVKMEASDPLLSLLLTAGPSKPSATEITYASLASREAAEDLERTSKRRVDIPIRKRFVRTPDDREPPLADLYVGGRGGAVAIKLYIALIWRCSAPPFSTDKPARAWATLLDLPDPEGKGARRVTAGFKALERRKLITVTPQPGNPSLITLMNEGGRNARYRLPSTGYTLSKARGASAERLEREKYFKMPTLLWRRGFIQALNGPGLVMLLILLAEQGGEGKEVWISPGEFASRYQLSHKARTQGISELKSLGLVTVARRGIGLRPGGSVFDQKRVRNIYRLTPIAQTVPTA